MANDFNPTNSDLPHVPRSEPDGDDGDELLAMEAGSATKNNTLTASGQPRKRKKAARACNHCQTAHLTCDDNRPCGRCVKRNLGDTCQDGVRKKAKYLRDIEDEIVNQGKLHPTQFTNSTPANALRADANDDSSLPNTTTHTSGSTSLLTSTQSPNPFSKPPSLGGISPSAPRSTSGATPLINSISLPGDPNGTSNDTTNNGSISVGHSNGTEVATYAGSALGDDSSHNPHNPHLLTSPDATNGLDMNASNANNAIGNPFHFFNEFTTTGDFGSSGANLEYAVLSSMVQSSGYNNQNGSNGLGGLSDNSPGGGNGTYSNGNANNGMMNSIHSPLNLFPSIQTGYGDPNNSGTPTSTTSSTGGNVSNSQTTTHTTSALTNVLTNGGVSGASQSFGFPPAAFESKSALHQASNYSQQQQPSSLHQNSLSPYTTSNTLPNTTTNNTANATTFTGNTIDHDWPPLRPSPSHISQEGRDYSQQQMMLHQHNLSTASKPVYSSTGVLKVEDVYRTVNKPYNYLEAYHALIRHLQANFTNKSDILRIIRAIAIYRPSLIALQMPLTVDDEIFVERSFQRTLIELEKLISFSGTPTLVWRRTGEIMLVGTEFLLLSEWKKNELLSQNNCFFQSNKNAKELKGLKRKYIFEIFDQMSTVEYYESFAAHAFESSSSTIMSTCNIVTPKGRKVPCTFAYNLKRDIFGLPNMVIGQFLPILNNNPTATSG